MPICECGKNVKSNAKKNHLYSKCHQKYMIKFLSECKPVEIEVKENVEIKQENVEIKEEKSQKRKVPLGEIIVV